MYAYWNVEESIKAAQEDIDSWNQQKSAEDGRVSQGEVSEKHAIAQDLIKEENDELTLIKSHCNEDIIGISECYNLCSSLERRCFTFTCATFCLDKKLGELDVELKGIKNQRDTVQNDLKLQLQNNRNEQEQLRARLAQLVKEDEDLTDKINQNDRLQVDADKVFKGSITI